MSEIISLKEAKARGLKRYFTGKPCPHGHFCCRDVAHRRCIECKRAYVYRPRVAVAKRSREKHPDFISRKEARTLGLTRFFSNKVCPQGHNVERYVASGACVLCSKAWMKRDAMDPRHRAKRREMRRKWMLKNKEHRRAKNREWRENNKEHVTDMQQRRYLENREERRAYGRERSKKRVIALQIIKQLAETDPYLKQLMGEINDTVG